MSSVTTMPRLTSRSAALGQVDIGADADRQHHQIGRNEAAVGQLHAFGMVGAGDFLGLAVGEEGDAAPVEIALQQLAGRGVELALHQGRHQMHQRHRHAALLQAPGRFQAQQTAADHHGALVGLGRRQHLVDIGDVAEGAGAGQAQAGNGRRQRLRSGGDQDLVIAHCHAGGRGDGAGLRGRSL